MQFFRSIFYYPTTLTKVANAILVRVVIKLNFILTTDIECFTIILEMLENS